MKNPLKRWDVFITLVVLFLTIPAERYEAISLLEDQSISMRQILRTSLGDASHTRLRDEIMIVSLDEDLYAEYGSFPFRRTDLGRIAQLLGHFGASVIAMDFLMDFRSSYGEDEPTAAMDAEAEAEIFQRLADLTDKQMAILISHRFSTVRMADDIVVLDQGKIVERGDHAELMAMDGRYAHMFTLQAAGYQ